MEVKINASVNGKAVLSASILHKLPEPYRTFRRTCVRPQGALGNSDVFEIIGQVIFPQHLFNNGEVAMGTLEPKNDLRSIPE